MFLVPETRTQKRPDIITNLDVLKNGEKAQKNSPGSQDEGSKNRSKKIGEVERDERMYTDKK